MLTVGGCSFMIHARHAASAIASGLCETVLITHGESGRSRVGRTRNGAVDPLWGDAEIVRDRHRRLAGGRNAVDVGGFEAGIGNTLSAASACNWICEMSGMTPSQVAPRRRQCRLALLHRHRQFSYNPTQHRPVILEWEGLR
jgi:hypothetical protein